MDTQEYDALEIRCPKLGHQLRFSYCRKEQSDLPCARSLICWEGRFPVSRFFQETLSDRQWNDCFEKPPQSKVVSLMELIEKAKKAGSEKG